MTDNTPPTPMNKHDLLDHSHNRSEFRKQLNDTPFTEHKNNTFQSHNKINNLQSNGDSIIKPTDEKNNALRQIPNTYMNQMSTAIKRKKSVKIIKGPQEKECSYKFVELMTQTSSNKKQEPVSVKCFYEDEMNIAQKFKGKIHNDLHHDDDIDTDEESYEKSIQFCVHQLKEGILEGLKDTGQIPRDDTRSLKEVMKWQKENNIPHDLNLVANQNRQKQLGKPASDKGDASETKRMPVTTAISNSHDGLSQADSNELQNLVEYRNNWNQNYDTVGYSSSSTGERVGSKTKNDFSSVSIDTRWGNVKDSVDLAKARYN